MADVFELAAAFNRDIVGIERTSNPTRLAGQRRDFRFGHLREELREFVGSRTLEDDVDALVDLIYVAAGALYEMGVDAAEHFLEVHRCNMRRVRGLNPSRGNVGFDAVKPDGWAGPDHRSILDRPRLGGLEMLEEETTDAGKACTAWLSNVHVESLVVGAVVHPKVVVIGHGRHGKDTVAEMLRDRYGLSFTSSSLFCAERVMLPAFKEHGVLYKSTEACYADRHGECLAVGDHRTFWFEEIARYCADPLRLGREILAEHDVYCGIRSRREFHAVKNAGIADLIVWVDASDRLPPEQASSMQLEPWMADVVIDNNGTLEDLERQVEILWEGRFA